ncbi:chromosome partitioning protein [Palleronia marisminoris]|uniref:Chromosome partitioning protein ParA n=1 Tax=Palleronia marisminoris TaxID=315423 RepID=A0A1Y5SXX0_9RHOB|nr:ParA family protein [Palleronia marisminoris]SFH06235.1 chromosome partitioning protein [Palleronia marisminoris]SLN51276.1 Chromosome partitioning protein ParA [Palleronia marisminoris]
MPETRSGGGKIVAIVNQKGGVGKTTTAINLGAALADQGKRVAIIDLDPQGNASTGLGIEIDRRQLSTYDLLLENIPLAEVLQDCAIENLQVVPATSDLSSADIEMVSKGQRTTLLKSALRGSAIEGLDFVLIDCPPSLSLLTVNAMVAAHSVLVPLQSEFFALEGLSQLMLTIREVRASANPDLAIEGVVLTMYDGRNKLAQGVLADAKETLGELVFDTIIPRNVRVSEAPSFAQPVLYYDPASKGSLAYRALAHEFVARDQV